MAYTTPLKVFRSMERTEEAVESFDNVSNGDTVQLTNQYIIKDTETVQLDGSDVAESDYSVDLQKNAVTYTGTSSGTLSVDYSFGPYNSSTVEDKISQVEDYIDEYTNSTYGGKVNVTDEVYDGGASHQTTYVLDKRPVRSVSKVAVNEPGGGSGNPNYEEVSEGLGNDYVEYKTLGIRFLPEGKSPSTRPEELQVSYEYGYSDVPGVIEAAATEMVIDDLIRGTVSGAMVDGRDNFDPQTVNVQSKQWREKLDQYRIQEMANMTNLAVEGSTS